MLSLRFIPVLWIVVVLCNLITKKAAPEISGWYLPYSIVIGVLTTGVLFLTASL